MKEFNFSKELNHGIVDGLMEGYRDYLEIRREKARELLVSGAYAWVKGNHIDDQVARSCKQYGVENKLSKAGLTWQYLQFQHKDEKTLFIVKNARYFNEEQVSNGRDASGNARRGRMSYMENLMRINAGVDFSKVRTVRPGDSIQLELLEENILSEKENLEIAKIETSFDRFYIITYEIDESQLIGRISLFMPNPSDNKAYFVDDLTSYIDPDFIQIDDELKEALANDIDTDDNYDAYRFDIGINKEDEEKDKEV